MVDIDISYEGDLHCAAKHLPSGSTLGTDAPVDNNGLGRMFSPTDLVAAALGSCMMTIMGIRANTHGYALEGISLRVTKRMTSAPPRRIEQLAVSFQIPSSVSASLDDRARAILEEAAETCPVRLSIAESIDVPIAFNW